MAKPQGNIASGVFIDSDNQWNSVSLACALGRVVDLRTSSLGTITSAPSALPIHTILEVGREDVNTTFGQLVGIRAISELTTVAAAAFTDTAIEIPANSVVVGVSVRVTVALAGTATMDVGIAGGTTRFATGVSTSENATDVGLTDAFKAVYTSATKIRLTPNTSPSDTLGRVRVTIHYIDLTAPTS
ncbi:hypothetical protein LCGC14_1387280 [marine sediment metagenome]|uniref:Uncharacterized protein n=1 Tax=marine sediment metagenome TaxID=412755 RepID=A0A0F9K165_9ZZZZ